MMMMMMITIIKLKQQVKIKLDDSENNQRKTIVNSWERGFVNDQMVVNSGFPTVNCRK